MRVKSAIWVMAHVRRCNAEGAMALVARRGQEDAGAIYVKVNTLDGRAALYVPAPTGMSLDASARCWVRLPAEGDMSDAEAEAYLSRQGEFD
ncbi:MAG: DUF1491 family protein, partial [Alphaproteobacteria bacterium]